MNLLEYEIINDKLRITQQWRILRGIGYIGEWNNIRVLSDSHPKIQYRDLHILGHEISRDKDPVRIPAISQDKVKKTLKTLSKIPVQTIDTRSGTVEYLETPRTIYHPVLILGISPNRILPILREINIAHDGFNYVKIQQPDLPRVLNFLNRRHISTIFFEEPRATI